MPEIRLTPASLDIVAYQGDPFGIGLTLTDSAGDPFDLTGYTAAMQIRLDVADSDPTIDATATVTVTNAASGEVEATIDRATMAGLAGKYVYDLQIVDGSGDPQTLIAGKFTVPQEVTR